MAEPKGRSAGRMLIGVGLLALLAYCVALAALFVYQRRLLYPGWGVAVGPNEAVPAGFEVRQLRTSDGETLAAWWKPPEPGRALLIYFFGNGGSLWNLRSRAALLAREGRGLLMVSYRGYPGSTGFPTETGLHLDAQAAYRWASSYDPARIVIYGESLGTGVAVRLAAEQRIGGLVLDAPYTSITDVARTAFWYVPLDWLLRDQFRSIERIASVRAPLLILHGEQDGVIPIALGRRVFEAAPEPKRFVEVPRAHHSEVLERGGLAEVASFVSEVEKRAAAPAEPQP